MQIVIDISEELYKASQILDSRYEYTVPLPFEVIRNGIPLPKGHGRLIDADALNFNADYYEPLISKLDFDSAPTIIEADRSEEE